MWKDLLQLTFVVSALRSFLQDYFCSALASGIYYLTIAKYSWENFHGTLKNHKNGKSLFSPTNLSPFTVINHHGYCSKIQVREKVTYCYLNILLLSTWNILVSLFLTYSTAQFKLHVGTRMCLHIYCTQNPKIQRAHTVVCNCGIWSSLN